jgi:hypothetical protein
LYAAQDFGKGMVNVNNMSKDPTHPIMIVNHPFHLFQKYIINDT